MSDDDDWYEYQRSGGKDDYYDFQLSGVPIDDDNGNWNSSVKGRASFFIEVIEEQYTKVRTTDADGKIVIKKILPEKDVLLTKIAWIAKKMYNWSRQGVKLSKPGAQDKILQYKMSIIKELGNHKDIQVMTDIILNHC